MKYDKVSCHGLVIKTLTIAELIAIAGEVQHSFGAMKKDKISEAMIRENLTLFLNKFLDDKVDDSKILALSAIQLDEVWIAICELNPQVKIVNLAASLLKYIIENNPEMLLPKA